MGEETIQIRSFRVVFDLERRIHRIDRFRVPLPYGLPVRSIGYAAATFVAVLLLQRAPAVGALLTSLDAPVRLVLLPIAASVALSRVRIDGRTAHAAAIAWAMFVCGPKRYVVWEANKAEDSVVLGDVLVARAERRPRKRLALSGRPPRPAAAPGQQLSFGSGLQMELW